MGGTATLPIRFLRPLPESVPKQLVTPVSMRAARRERNLLVFAEPTMHPLIDRLVSITALTGGNMEIEFERSRLYAEVWSLPLTQLAMKYKLSDNGLRKICKALNIPLPERGYWAKVSQNIDPSTRKEEVRFGGRDPIGGGANGACISGHENRFRAA